MRKRQEKIFVRPKSLGPVHGQARSIKLKLAAEELPSLHGMVLPTIIAPPPRRSEGQPFADTKAALLRLGRIQIEDLFAHKNRNPLDDSAFIPLLGTLIESFARAVLDAPLVKELRRHACELYHRTCQEAEPKSSFEANIEFMFSHLPSPTRTYGRQSI